MWSEKQTGKKPKATPPQKKNLIDDRRQIGGCLRWTVEEVGEHGQKVQTGKL